MERILYDAAKVLEVFNKENNPLRKSQYAYDYLGINDMLTVFFNRANKLEIPKEILMAFYAKKESIEHEKTHITKQIYANLDKLEALYDTFITHFFTIDFSRVSFTDKKVYFDYSILKSFFKKIQLEEEYLKTINSGRLFFLDKDNVASSVTLKSINKQYVFLSKDNTFDGMKMFAHEMGHLHASNITFNSFKQDKGFLNEFMSIYFENMFLENSDVDTDILHKEKINSIMGFFIIIKQALSQIMLMKNFDDAFVDMCLNPAYKELLDSLSSTQYSSKRNTLELQYYALGYLLSISFLKRKMSIAEVENFYKNNFDSHNLSSILDYISIEDIYKYIDEVFNVKEKIKVKE